MVLIVAVGMGLGGFFASQVVDIRAREHAHAAATVSDDEACLAADVLAARAAVGSPAIPIDPVLAAYGRAHAEAMSATGTIFHSGGSPS